MSSTVTKALAAAVLLSAFGSPAGAETEIGFVEEYALADDRGAALQELVPGGEEFFHFHALHYEETGDEEALDALLGRWAEHRAGSELLRRFLDRRALRQFEDDPDAAALRLRQHLSFDLEHRRKDAAQQDQFPSRLDPDQISPAVFLKRARDRHENLGGLSPDYLAELISSGGLPDDLTLAERIELLQRLPRTDLPDIIGLIAADLKREEEPVFGSRGVHRLLTLKQLDELAELVPRLQRDPGFVDEKIRRFFPSMDEDLRRQPEVRAAFLVRCWDYVQDLPDSFSGLKIHVLYHLLVHRRDVDGEYPHGLFREYLKLPRHASIGPPLPPRAVRPEPTDATGFLQGCFLLPAAGGPQPILDPVNPGSDEALLRSFLLERFTRSDDKVETYKDQLDIRWLRNLYAEAKALAGEGDAEQWAGVLGAGRFAALRDRVDIDFVPGNPSTFAIGDEVSLEVDLKNVPDLIVRVYEINTLGYYRSEGREIGSGLALDGIVANAEAASSYDQPALVRHRETFAFPEIEDRPGVWVVEFIGGPKSSRAIVRKGDLHALRHTGPAGSEITVVDQDGERVKGAVAYFGGRKYEEDEDGLIRLPFSGQAGRQKVVLAEGPDARAFASLVELDLGQEEYQLGADFHLPQEQLVAGGVATLLVRPHLTLNGATASASLLKSARLIVVATLKDGTSTTQDVGDLELVSDAEFVHRFAIPERLSQLQFILQAKIEKIDGTTVPLPPATFLVTGDRGTPLAKWHASRGADGYRLELRGRNGEPIAGETAPLQVVREGFVDALDIRLRTDGDGRIQLGELDGIRHVLVSSYTGYLLVPAHPSNTGLPEVAMRSAHALTLPYFGEAEEANRAEFSLHEIRSGGRIAADFFEKIAIEDGQVVITDLGPGHYLLRVRSEGGGTTKIDVSGAETSVAGFALGEVHHLRLGPAIPLGIVGAEVDGGDLVVRLINADKRTRIHLHASHLLPQHTPHNVLAPGRGSTSAYRLTPAHRPSTYMSGREIGEEFRYILDRRRAEKFPGLMAPRPGLLLNPWAIRETTTTTDQAKAGQQWGAEDEEVSERLERGGGAGALGVVGQVDYPGTHDFLPGASPVGTNLRPDEDGVFRISLEEFGDYHLIDLVATNDHGAAYRQVVLPEPEDAPLRDRRLLTGLDPEVEVTMGRNISVLRKGGSLTIAESSSAQVELYDSVDDLYALYASANPDAGLAIFEFLLRWPDLEGEEKRALYAEHACHELHFFLSRRDPEFFDGVVKPYLANKFEKTFLDHYLLGADLRPYLAPAALSRLNAAERALLARALEAQRSGIARYLLESAPDPDPAGWLHHFSTGLGSKGLVVSRLAVGQRFFEDGAAEGEDGNGEGTESANGIAGRGLGWGYRQRSAGDTPADDSGVDGERQGAITMERVREFAESGQMDAARGLLDEKLAEDLQEGGARRYLSELSHSGDRSGSHRSGVEADDRLFDQAVTYWDLAQYGKAEEAALALLETDRYNAAARSLLERIASMDPDDYGKGRDQLRAEMLRQVDATWEEKTLLGAGSGDAVYWKTVRALYRPAGQVKIWAEHNYYRLPLAEGGGGLITPDSFWADFAAWDGRGPFLSEHILEAGGNLHEILLALSVIGLPFEAAEHASETGEDGARTFTAASPAIIFHQGVGPAAGPDGEAVRPLLVAQIITWDGDNRDPATIAADPPAEFLVGRPYHLTVSVTNPTATPRQLDLLAQIPRGAIALGDAKPTLAQPLAVGPFATATAAFSFYFPQAGEFVAYSPQASVDGAVVGRAEPLPYLAVDEFSKVDESSWDHISQEGTAAEVMGYLATADLSATDLSMVAWRCRENLRFLRRLVAFLEENHHYDPTIYAYGLHHGDAAIAGTFLENSGSAFLDHLGPAFRSPLFATDRRERRAYEHLEYDPLINARSHPLGGRRQILNPDLARHYHDFLWLLAYTPELGPDEHLAAAYFLLLQDRTDEALTRFDRVGKGEVDAALQHDYFAAVAHALRGERAASRALTEQHLEHPAERWRTRFVTLLAHLDEADGRLPQDDGEAADNNADPNALAATEPALEMEIGDGGSLTLRYRNLDSATIDLFPMDIEFLFSGAPFQTLDGEGAVSLVRPARSIEVELPAGDEEHTLRLPPAFRERNCLVEVSGAGITRSGTSLASRLNLTLTENYGRLQVTHADTGKPLPETYVKVYADTPAGPVFHKDGYTDLRGRFDYVSLNTPPPAGTRRLALLVLHEAHGAAIHQAQLPAE